MSLSRFSDWLKRSSTNEAHNIYGSVLLTHFWVSKIWRAASMTSRPRASDFVARARCARFVRGRLVASLCFCQQDMYNGPVNGQMDIQMVHVLHGHLTCLVKEQWMMNSLNSYRPHVHSRLVYLPPVYMSMDSCGSMLKTIQWIPIATQNGPFPL